MNKDMTVDEEIGYNVDGYDRNGYDRNGYDVDGYDVDGFDVDGFDVDGFDVDGFDVDGFDVDGFDEFGYDKFECDEFGYDKFGYDKFGYDKFGYDEFGYDEYGYNSNGFNRDGFDEFGYDEYGYNSNGFNRDGFDEYGIPQEEYQEYDEEDLGNDEFEEVSRWKSVISHDEILNRAESFDELIEVYYGVPLHTITFTNDSVTFKAVDKDPATLNDFTEEAISSMLQPMELGAFSGGKKTLANYFFGNLTNANVIADMNSQITNLVNRAVEYNIYTHNGTVYGFDAIRRVYQTAGDILIPILTKLPDARCVHFELTPTDVTISLMIREYESKEKYGMGVRVTHSFTGKANTKLTPLLKMAACDNSITPAYRQSIQTIAGFGTKYSLMLDGIESFIDGMTAEIELLEKLSSIETTVDKFLQMMTENKITPSTEQFLHFIEGCRGDKENSIGYFLNGLTYMAHKGNFSYSEQVHIETLAGKLISSPEQFFDIPVVDGAE